MRPDLSVEIAGMRWDNPITTASGTFAGYENYARLFPLDTFGAITVKSVSVEPRAGNPPPRLCETPAGLMNTIGLPNPGLAMFLKEELPKLRRLGNAPVVVSISGHSIGEYVLLAERLSQEPGVSALEINMSCPNVGKEAMEFGQSAEGAFELVRATRKATHLPLLAKLTPNVTDIAQIARAVEAAGADAISLINTIVAIAIDIHTGLPKTGTLTAGLSGPAIKPIAVRMVWQVAEAVKVPVIGMGGIQTWEDVVEFMMAGATGVALGTSLFVHHRGIVSVLAGLTDFLEKRGLTSVRELIGLAQRNWSRYQPERERLHATPAAG